METVKDPAERKGVARGPVWKEADVKEVEEGKEVKERDSFGSDVGG